jgi:hypothetical protein
MALPGYAAPARRPLQIFAFDPMIARTERRKLTLEVPNEPLRDGPIGSRIEVIDYDGANRVLYEPVNLNDPAVLMNDGLTPTESDPRFHQQMVYAVAMKTLENFEQSLGRKLRFIDGRSLRLFPHGFEGANAFYDPATVSILFGYFRADDEDPGPNLPGQTVFSCLSHDIIAHETTHAVVHRLRRHFSEATNRDVLAFHEGFADIVAIFQHFSFRDVLADSIQKTHIDLRVPQPLIDLAEQFGYAAGTGRSLRSALGPDDGNRPDPKLYTTLLEPHDRGSLLVESVFDAFFTTYQRRIRDLIRIATGGSGVLPAGDLHPDLVNRIAREASRTAQNVLTMCIRAFEYLPPVDVTFGDFLRAMITADYEAVPEDGVGLRAAMVESFRLRGIYPDGVTSLAEEALLWPKSEGLALPLEPYQERLAENAKAYDRWGATGTVADSGMGKWAAKLDNWANEHAAELGLDAGGQKIHVLGFHTLFRVSPDGQLAIELVAQFDQLDPRTNEDPDYGGVPFRGGATVIGGADGVVRYVISKPMSDERRKRQKEYVADLDQTDFALTWTDDDKYESSRMRARTSFAALHRGVR